MRVQVTLTVPEGKRLIAKGIAARADVKKAFADGRILLRGGTTVSTVCEELCGKRLRVSGRVTPKGTKSSKSMEQQWHCALIEKGQLRNIDDEIEEAVSQLEKDDIVILGVNAFDNYGHSALMFGRALGGFGGRSLSGMMAEVNKVIIAVGLEKLVPGNLNDIIRDTGRKQVDFSMGMAVGLVPISGEIYTEVEAIKTLGNVSSQVISKGGVSGAEGASTLIIDGEETEVLKVFQIIKSLKGMGECVLEDSLEECTPGEKCKFHLACIYKRKNI